MRYPIGVPIGVPFYCSIWTSFWNILNMSYFIYSVVKVMSQDEVSLRNLRGRRLHFCAIDTWSSPQKILILTLRCLRQNVKCHVVALIELEHFRIVTHCYSASFSQKFILCETNNIFTADNIKFDTKITTNSESSSKMNMRSRWTLSSAAICMQRTSQKNEAR